MGWINEKRHVARFTEEVVAGPAFDELVESFGAPTRAALVAGEKLFADRALRKETRKLINSALQIPTVQTALAAFARRYPEFIVAAAGLQGLSATSEAPVVVVVPLLAVHRLARVALREALEGWDALDRIPDGGKTRRYVLGAFLRSLSDHVSTRPGQPEICKGTYVVQVDPAFNWLDELHPGHFYVASQGLKDRVFAGKTRASCDALSIRLAAMTLTEKKALLASLGVPDTGESDASSPTKIRGRRVAAEAAAEKISEAGTDDETTPPTEPRKPGWIEALVVSTGLLVAARFGLTLAEDDEMRIWALVAIAVAFLFIGYFRRCLWRGTIGAGVIVVAAYAILHYDELSQGRKSAGEAVKEIAGFAVRFGPVRAITGIVDDERDRLKTTDEKAQEISDRPGEPRGPND